MTLNCSPSKTPASKAIGTIANMSCPRLTFDPASVNFWSTASAVKNRAWVTNVHPSVPGTRSAALIARTYKRETTSK